MNYVQQQLAIWQQAERLLLSRFGKVIRGWFGWLHRDARHLDEAPPVFELEKALRDSVPLAVQSTVELARLERGLYGSADTAMAPLARYYQLHAPSIAGGATEDIQSRLRILLFRAKQTGATDQDAARMMVKAGLPFTAGRLKNIARTELTNASTLGRLGLYRQNDLRIMRYSNVLDDRTTRTCRTAAGLLLDVSRPLDQEILPANHYFCRSLIVPAYGVQTPSPEDAIARVIEVRNEEFPGWVSRLRPFVQEVYGG